MSTEVNKFENQFKRLYGNATIKQVSFNYLGDVSSKGSCKTKVNHRISGSTKLYHALKGGFVNRIDITKSTEENIFKIIYAPTLIYGSKFWVQKDKNVKFRQVI